MIQGTEGTAKTADGNPLVKRYKNFISNIEWHINTNKPTGTELLNCKEKIEIYKEVVKDIESFAASQSPAAGVWVRCAEKLPTGTVPVVNIKMRQVGKLTISEESAIFSIEYPKTQLVYKFDDAELFNNFIWWQSESSGQEQGQAAEFQLCPKCSGQGRVSKPPGLAAEITHWSGTALDYECDVCNGSKTIARPNFRESLKTNQ